MTALDCVFCRIVAGKEPSAVVATNDRSMALLTIQPATVGHTLVVPRRHARNLLDVPSSDLTSVMLMSQEIALRQRERLGAEGVSLFQANEVAGFQSVFHFHVHVVPRYPDDGVMPAWRGIPHGSMADLERVAQRLRPPALELTGHDGVAVGEPTHGMGAASVIVDARGRVLLVRHSYGRRNWEIPGGASEIGESAEATARREAREELGVEIEIDRLSGVYWEREWGRVGGHHFVFRARLPDGALPRAADPSEILDLSWCSAEALPRPISDFTVRRVRDALDDGQVPFGVVGTRVWVE